MNKALYDTLTDREKLFADLLNEIVTSLHKMERDISGDIERSLH